MTDGGTVRAFFGLPLSPEAHEGVRAAQDEMRRKAARLDLSLRWALPEQLHVTLVFLGDVEDSAMPRFADAASRCAAQVPLIEVRLGGVGVFGSMKRATTLFVAVLDPTGEISHLAHALEDEAEALGVPREKRGYVPHVTLGRFRGPTDATKLLLAAEPVDLPARFDVVRLYESRLTTTGGGRYTVRGEARLGVAPTPLVH